jgi:hypothetical protein
MHIRKLVITFAFTLGVVACGDGSGNVDSGVPDMAFFELKCVTDKDCPATDPICLYDISRGCAATGRCGLAQQNPGVTLELCGCNGQLVQTTTWYYAGGVGFAFGPVRSAETYPSCARDGGT